MRVTFKTTKSIPDAEDAVHKQIMDSGWMTVPPPEKKLDPMNTAAWSRAAQSEDGPERGWPRPASWATSGGEGAALSYERDRFQKSLALEFGYEPTKKAPDHKFQW